jgi:hypothetical protein
LASGGGELPMERGVVKEVIDCLALDAIHELRVRAWAAERLLPPGTLSDGTLADPPEESARHWGRSSGGGCCRCGKAHSPPDRGQRFHRNYPHLWVVCLGTRLISCGMKVRDLNRILSLSAERVRNQSGGRNFRLPFCSGWSGSESSFSGWRVTGTRRAPLLQRSACRSDRPKLFSAIAPGLFQTSFWGLDDPCTLCRR